jgi:hypothetical protein
MTTVKRIANLANYTGVLPYASEMFGVYQPLLGWKSKRIEQRIAQGFENDRSQLIEKLKRDYHAIVDIKSEDGQIGFDIKPGIIAGGKIRTFDSIVLKKISEKLPPFERLEPQTWSATITHSLIDQILDSDVRQSYSHAYDELRRTREPIDTGFRPNSAERTGATPRFDLQRRAFGEQFEYESSVAGAVLDLVQRKQHDVLKELFYATIDSSGEVERLARMASAGDGADALLDIANIDPRDREQIKSVALSPIAVVHLFRQYFFELDTFLGPPVSHVWLSPGSSVELVEVHTRRTLFEKTLEESLEVLTNTERTGTQQDEISDAVKEDNQREVKFGASVQASYASIEATSSFDYSSSQQRARETTHKQMRQQTEKLSSQIRKNFKSTFRTEMEDWVTSSTRHVLANTTPELINYELRRKMQQVCVQVHDMGTFLCWQTYVDDPGSELGLAKLIHVAKPPDLDSIPHPQEIPLLQPFQEAKTVTIPFISVAHNADKSGEVYVNGVEQDDTEWGHEEERIQADFPFKFMCPKPDHDLTNIEVDPQGQPVVITRTGDISPDGAVTLHLQSADFQGKDNIALQLTLHWTPRANANDAINAKNKENVEQFNEEERAAYEKAYVEAAKDRVTAISKLRTRNRDELREEERIVVYRKLIQEMLLNGIDLPDDRTRHVTAELLNSIFDVDKMLYFVAPEWWRPRLHRSRQQLQASPGPRTGQADFAATAEEAIIRGAVARRIVAAAPLVSPNVLTGSTVGWGGMNEMTRDSYFITEDSEPARLGSSLGWLLQLDGDNMRNAFLNAPWVKAVIPIRPGREKAAINWLKGVEGMNGITDDVIYHASNPNEHDIEGNPLEGQKMIDVLMDLAEKIRRKYEEGIATDKYPKQDEVSDPALVDEENTVTATPIDRVYEHGFFPLEGSFRANVGKNYEIFDQWIEILPTDQVVPVEVTYDPKTGRQL